MDITKEKLLKSSEVFDMLEKANTPISRSTFDRWLKEGYLPQPAYTFGRRTRRWTETQIKTWLAQRVNDTQAPSIDTIDFDNAERLSALKDEKIEINVGVLVVLLSHYYTGGGEPDSLNARLRQAIKVANVAD